MSDALHQDAHGETIDEGKRDFIYATSSILPLGLLPLRVWPRSVGH